MNLFNEKIRELGTLLNTPLHTFKEYFCTLIIQNFFKVHLEYEPNQDRILIASFLCDVPPGHFREEVFLESLKSNSSINSFGSFGFEETQNKLAFFIYIPALVPTQQLADILAHFIEEGKKWKVAVDTGDLSQIKQHTSPPLQL